MAEWNSQTAARYSIEVCTKSFFDGLTFGVFSGGDPFAESNKLNAWAERIIKRRNSLMTESSLAVNMRNISFLVLIGSVGWGIYQQRLKKGLS